MDLLPFQRLHARRVADALLRHRTALDASDPGCHAAGTPILLHDGRIVPVEEVRVGDRLMGWDSTPREVLSLTRGREEMARIVPVKGEPFTVNLSHILTLQYTRKARRHGGQIIDISVRDYLALNPTRRQALKLIRVPVNPWLERDLPVHPYHLGILLGDGCLKRGALSLSKPGAEMLSAASEIAVCHEAEVVTRLRSPGNPTHRFRLSRKLWAALDGLGLGGTTSHTKFVPLEYKAASIAQRSDILAGLLDTDGHCCGGGYDFISASRQLAEDAAYLARSLGLAAYVKATTKRCQTGGGGIYWRVSISGDCSFLPLRIPAKRASPRRQIKSVLRTGFRVELLPEDDFYGFSITGDGRFCLGDFTVTHNTGKTYIASHVAKTTGLSLLVICPKPVLPAWRKVTSSFGTAVTEITNYEQIRLGKTPFGRFVDKRFVWSVPLGTLLVFDEAQKCKARTTQNAEMLIAAKRQGIATLLCSATAASNPLEMRAIGYALGLHRLHDYWAWAINHGVQRGRFGMEFNGDHDVLWRLHSQIFSPGGPGSRLRIADIPEFPETQIIAEPVATGEERKIQRIYDQMARDLNKALAIEDHDELSDLAVRMDATKANHLTILLRARQQIEALKAKTIAAMAIDGAEEGMSVAVFVNFDESIDEVAKLLKTSCVIRGDQRDADREQSIRRFQTNQEKFIVCNIRAGGVGVSLHDPTGAKPRLALISPTYSAQDLRQALGRIHRAGGAHSIQRIIFAAGTCEERACDAVATKLAHIDLLNDGDLQGQFMMPASQEGI